MSPSPIRARQLSFPTEDSRCKAQPGAFAGPVDSRTNLKPRTSHYRFSPSSRTPCLYRVRAVSAFQMPEEGRP